MGKVGRPKLPKDELVQYQRFAVHKDDYLAFKEEFVNLP